MGEVQLQMAAAGGGLEDTVQLMVPVFAFADPQTMTTTGEVRDRSVIERVGLPAQAHGLAVGREYFAVDPATFAAREPAVDRARIGDVMEVRLTLIVPERRPVNDSWKRTSRQLEVPTARSPEFGEVMPECDAELEWWRRPWWGYWVESQPRDEKVALFATSLDAGTYQYTYLIRAGLAGIYHVVPTRAEEMYRPDVFGRSAGGVFVVEPRYPAADRPRPQSATRRR